MRAYVGPMGLLCVALVLGILMLRDRSAQVTFPLRTDGRYTASPEFSGSAGLYLITLEMDAIQDRHHSSCLLGGDLQPHPAPTGTVGTEGCDVAPLGPPRWRLTHGSEVVARDDDPEAMRGVEPFARTMRDTRRVERELGTVQLDDGQSYRLEVREVPPFLARTTPRIHLRLHPWDVKAALGRRALSFLAACLLGAGSVVWLVRVVRSRKVSKVR